MALLLDALPDLARTDGAVTAVRDRSAGAWRFLSWSELYSEVNRVAGALSALPRGERHAWTAPPGTRRLAVDLALQHLGVVGELGGPDAVAYAGPDYDALLKGRDELGRLVRLVAELRPRDPAVVRGGRVWSHHEVGELGRRLAASWKLTSPEPVLVSAGPAVEQAAGWGAVAAGVPLVVGEPDLLPLVAPVVWVCTAEHLRGLGLERSRAGGLGAVLRPLGRSAEHIGDRLQRVFVDGPVPAEADALRERGVEVSPWAG